MITAALIILGIYVLSLIVYLFRISLIKRRINKTMRKSSKMQRRNYWLMFELYSDNEKLKEYIFKKYIYGEVWFS